MTNLNEKGNDDSSLCQHFDFISFDRESRPNAHSRGRYYDPGGELFVRVGPGEPIPHQPNVSNVHFDLEWAKLIGGPLH